MVRGARLRRLRGRVQEGSPCRKCGRGRGRPGPWARGASELLITGTDTAPANMTPTPAQQPPESLLALGSKVAVDDKPAGFGQNSPSRAVWPTAAGQES